jgi:hypothetical protein
MVKSINIKWRMKEGPSWRSIWYRREWPPAQPHKYPGQILFCGLIFKSFFHRKKIILKLLGVPVPSICHILVYFDCIWNWFLLSINSTMHYKIDLPCNIPVFFNLHSKMFFMKAIAMKKPWWLLGQNRKKNLLFNDANFKSTKSKESHASLF